MEPTLKFLSLQMDEWLQALEPDSSSPVRLTISASVHGSRSTLRLCADLVRADTSGEWWGSGIQRGYGLTNGDKRFSLFAVHRWPDGLPSGLPPEVGMVPVLYRGKFNTNMVQMVMESLRVAGSVAAPGFMKPEGIIIFQEAAGQLFKVTLEDDEAPKGLTARTKSVKVTKKEETNEKPTTTAPYVSNPVAVSGADGPGTFEFSANDGAFDDAGILWRRDATGTPE